MCERDERSSTITSKDTSTTATATTTIFNDTAATTPAREINVGGRETGWRRGEGGGMCSMSCLY